MDAILLSNENEIQNLVSLNAYPNPNDGLFQIEYSLIGSSNVILNLFDLSGRLISSTPLGHQSNGEQKINVNLTDQGLRNGVYLVEILSDYERGYMKVLIGS